MVNSIPLQNLAGKPVLTQLLEACGACITSLSEYLCPFLWRMRCPMPRLAPNGNSVLGSGQSDEVTDNCIPIILVS